MPSGRTIAVGACVVALLAAPPAATAVARIRSADIVDGQVRTQDLAKGAVTSKKVENDSLTGKDVKEATLDRVPEAASVRGLTLRKVYLDKGESGSGGLLSMAGLRVRYSCNNPGELFVYARTVGSSGGTFSYNNFAGSATGFTDPGEEVEIASPPIGSRTVGHLQYVDPARHVVTLDWTFVSLDRCQFFATAVGG